MVHIVINVRTELQKPNEKHEIFVENHLNWPILALSSKIRICKLTLSTSPRGVPAQAIISFTPEISDHFYHKVFLGNIHQCSRVTVITVDYHDNRQLSR